MWPLWWWHVHHPCRASTTLEARLGNSSPTCFHAKQAARSRCVSHVVLILSSVLWRNRQIIAHLVLRHKPRNRRHRFCGQTGINCHGYFEVQITKPQRPVLRPKSGNPQPLALRANREKLSPPILRPKRKKPSMWFSGQTTDKPSQWFWDQTTDKPSQWFWGQTTDKPSKWFWSQITDKPSILVLRPNH
jgi:hypothetical protein